jgi:hypothetical protein
LKHEGTKIQRHEGIGLIGAKGFRNTKARRNMFDGRVNAKGVETRRHKDTKELIHAKGIKLPTSPFGGLRGQLKNGNLLLFLLKKIVSRILFLKKSNKNDRK